MCRCARLDALEEGSTLAAGRWSCELTFGVVGVSAGAARSLWRGVWRSGRKTNQQQHNQALHPTARSVVVFAAFRLDSKLVVTGGRRVSLALCRCAYLDASRQAVLGRWKLAASGASWRRRLCRRARLAGSGAAFGVRGAKQINSDTTRRCTRPPAVLSFLRLCRSAQSWS